METTTLIPLEQLRPSPTNPRRTYVDETLAELCGPDRANAMLKALPSITSNACAAQEAQETRH